MKYNNSFYKILDNEIVEAISAIILILGFIPIFSFFVETQFFQYSELFNQSIGETIRKFHGYSFLFFVSFLILLFTGLLTLGLGNSKLNDIWVPFYQYRPTMFIYVILQYFLSIKFYQNELEVFSGDGLFYLFPVIIYIVRGYLRRISELELEIEKMKNEKTNWLKPHFLSSIILWTIPRVVFDGNKSLLFFNILFPYLVTVNSFFSVWSGFTFLKSFPGDQSFI